jgi:hypothetical protein
VTAAAGGGVGPGTVPVDGDAGRVAVLRLLPAEEENLTRHQATMLMTNMAISELGG